LKHTRKNKKRKQYSGSKRFDTDCRNHGGCGWCRGNRLYNKLKTDEHSANDLKEYVDLNG